MALLEQNKARVSLSTEDDESLEQAFLEVASESTAQKRKRTREDLIRELKEKRQTGAADSRNGFTKAEDEARTLEEAKRTGKFKPIGLPGEEKSKRKSGKEKEKEQGKKKRKVERDDRKAKEDRESKKTTENLMPPPSTLAKVGLQPQPTQPQAAEPEPISGDLDIFVGAGEYEGIDLDEDDDDEDKPKHDDPTADDEAAIPSDKQAAGGVWFAIEQEPTPRTQESKPDPTPSNRVQEGNEEEEIPLRLVPLETSAVPHIKDFLAMDEAAEALEKRRKRKDKRKGEKGGEPEEKKKVSAEVKAERDWKRSVFHGSCAPDISFNNLARMQSYTRKKAES
jgi:IK cytokine